MINLPYAGIIDGRNFIGEFWHGPDFLEALFNYRALPETVSAWMEKHKSGSESENQAFIASLWFPVMLPCPTDGVECGKIPESLVERLVDGVLKPLVIPCHSAAAFPNLGFTG